MVRLLLFCSMLLPIQLCANEIYQHKDKYGRLIFSDKPIIDHSQKTIRIEIQNDYDWHNPKLKLRKSHKIKKKKRQKKEKTFTFAQLQNKCSTARYRYQNYRGNRNNVDWGKYKNKMNQYRQQRDYWCSRALKRK